jgi:hypothetical protein
VVVIGGYDCWLEGGQRRVESLADVWQYSPDSDCWSCLPPLPIAVAGAAAVALDNGSVVLLGGAAGERQSLITAARLDAKRGVVVGEYSASAWCLDVGARAWRRLPSPLVEGVNDLRACVVGGLVVAAGGENMDPTLSNTTNACQVGQPVWEEDAREEGIHTAP